MDKAARMRELIAKLNEASASYYSSDIELMSDYQYDALYDELLRLEAETGITLPNSPTKRVGYEVMSQLKKHVHEHRLLSLDKTKEIDKLIAFLSDGEGILSWKLDGLTVVLNYEGGKLVRAVTRGNGETGEVITHNANTFINLPRGIAFQKKLTLRGEAVISYKNFEKINESLTGEEKYKNPRNLTSGTVRQLDSAICAARNVELIAFALVSAEGEEFSKKSEQMEWLRKNGFDIAEYKNVTKDDVGGCVEAFKERAADYEYATDGLVLTYDDIAFSESLGATSKFPRDAIAFKWKDEQAETVLVDVVWNTSRTGLINPVAVFEPVELLGTTVSRASLHNISIIEALELGIGDKLSIYKANMIIPQIAENLTRGGGVEIPEKCGVCGFDTEIENRLGVKTLYCTNPNCRAQLVRALTHFAGRDAMNIEGFSIQSIERFVELGFLKSYADIFTLSQYEEEIMSLDGFGKKSYQKLSASIEKARSCELHSFIYALGINHIGLASAKLLCRHFNYDLAGIINAEQDELERIEGFGGIMAHAVRRYFDDSQNMELLNRALAFLEIRKPETAGEQKLSGLIFVITGSLEHFSNRGELQSYIERLGGKTAQSVSAKTSFLINNDNTSASAKNKKAGELNVPVITEQEFLRRFAIVNS